MPQYSRFDQKTAIQPSSAGTACCRSPRAGSTVTDSGTTGTPRCRPRRAQRADRGGSAQDHRPAHEQGLPWPPRQTPSTPAQAATGSRRCGTGSGPSGTAPNARREPGQVMACGWGRRSVRGCGCRSCLRSQRPTFLVLTMSSCSHGAAPGGGTHTFSNFIADCVAWRTIPCRPPRPSTRGGGGAPTGRKLGPRVMDIPAVRRNTTPRRSTGTSIVAGLCAK